MNKPIRLTDALVQKAISGKAEPYRLVKKHDAISDSIVPGLKIIKSGTNIFSFRFNYRISGKRRNITLGSYPAINCNQARGLAKTRAIEVATGNDPIADKQTARTAQENTLRSYLDHDYTLYMQSRAITAKEYLSLIRNNFTSILDNPISKITKTDLVKWVQFQIIQHDKEVKGFSSATIRKRYSALKSLMSHAVRHDVIEHNPFDKMDKLEFSKDESTQQQTKRTYLTLDQQKQLLQSINNYDQKLRTERSNSRAHGKSYLTDLDGLAFSSHHKPMMLILYFMGMRLGDVVGLEWVHIQDNKFTCNISKVLEKTRRKVKTPCIIPMPKSVRDALRLWFKQQGKPSRGLVFPNSTTGDRLSVQPLARCWKWIKKDAGFRNDLQLYSLRHNYISWLIMNNIPLSVIASMVGHSSTDMINSNYGHLIAGADTTASNSFAELLSREA